MLSTSSEAVIRCQKNAQLHIPHIHFFDLLPSTDQLMPEIQQYTVLTNLFCCQLRSAEQFGLSQTVATEEPRTTNDATTSNDVRTYSFTFYFPELLLYANSNTLLTL